jgi:hypothetical protein
MDTTRDPTDPAAGDPRARWRAAEEQLYPTLIANRSTYQLALDQIQAVVDEVRRRGEDMAALLAVEADAEQVLASACPEGVGLPTDLLLGVACAVRDRELTAASERQRVERVVAAARSAGAQWASLRGPESPAELTEGSTAALHLSSETMLTATVDPWSGGPPYGLQVAPTDGPPTSRNFADRAEWLAEYRRCRTELAAAPPGSAGTPAT